MIAPIGAATTSTPSGSTVSGPVRVVGPDGYRLETPDVLVDLKQRQLASPGPVAGPMRLGRFQAGRLRADLGERKVMLDGGELA